MKLSCTDVHSAAIVVNARNWRSSRHNWITGNTKSLLFKILFYKRKKTVGTKWSIASRNRKKTISFQSLSKNIHYYIKIFGFRVIDILLYCTLIRDKQLRTTDNSCFDPDCHPYDRHIKVCLLYTSRCV